MGQVMVAPTTNCKMMMATTRRVAALYRPRHFSGSTTTSDAPSSNNNSLPPWLNRLLHVWDQESGTHEILQLKNRVNNSSIEFDTKQHQVTQARILLDRALQSFENSQLQHTQLLSNRDRWTPSQALEFAKLLEKEVAIRAELETAKKSVTTLETQQIHAMNTYMNDLRKRYTEEQLWQEKWRVYSTYGTWGLLILNSVVFLISQYVYRIRENQRMKEIKVLLEQSLMANEGSLRALREQKQQQQMKSNEKEQRDIEESKDDAKIEVAAEAVKKNETEDENNTPHLLDDEEEEKQQQIINKYPLMIHWMRIQQYATHISKKILPDTTCNVDVPSAMLGASMTGLAWLVATTLSSKGSGSQ